MPSSCQRFIVVALALLIGVGCTSEGNSATDEPADSFTPAPAAGRTTGTPGVCVAADVEFVTALESCDEAIVMSIG